MAAAMAGSFLGGLPEELTGRLVATDVAWVAGAFVSLAEPIAVAVRKTTLATKTVCRLNFTSP